jgi:hypothetical protein
VTATPLSGEVWLQELEDAGAGAELAQVAVTAEHDAVDEDELDSDWSPAAACVPAPLRQLFFRVPGTSGTSETTWSMWGSLTAPARQHGYRYVWSSVQTLTEWSPIVAHDSRTPPDDSTA